MKKTLLLISILFLFASFGYALTCELTQGQCVGDNASIILCLSDETNAHAELPYQIGDRDICPNYEWKVCCRDTVYVSNECKGNYAVVAWLNDITNAHAAVIKDSTYSIPVCISGLRSASCLRKSGPGEFLISLNLPSNAHLSGLKDNSYPDDGKLYCTVNSDKDGDGFSANEDCDDDNPNVYPGAPEIGNGIDDNCNGLIDGDDPSFKDLPEGWYQLSKDSGFSEYTPGGVKVEEGNGSVNVFRITENKNKAIVSKKIKVESGRNYVASIHSTCEATLQLAFGNQAGSKVEGGLWSFLTGKPLNNSVAGTGKISLTVNSEDSDQVQILINAKTKDCLIQEPQLELRGRIHPADYNDLYTPTDFTQITDQPIASASCCPQGECWNGFTCIENMRDNTFMAENVSGKAVYRCIDGSWVFMAMLYDWNNQEWGSCADEGQCFVLSSIKGADPRAKAGDFYEGKIPTCIDDKEFIFDHYCDNGTWTSRTKFLATKFLEVYGNNDYVLYCADYQEALLDYQDKINYLGGRSTAALSAKTGLGGALGGANATAETANICFPNIIGKADELVPTEKNTCINNVCILKYKSGGGFKTAFATTMNRDLNEADSFLVALNIPQNRLASACQEGTDFVKCSLAEITGDLWYSSQLGAVIYGKEGVKVENGIFDKIINWFGNLFGGKELGAEKTLIENATKFNQVYFLSSGDKKIRVVSEAYPGRGTLVAEYDGFTTPVCDYLENIDLPAGVGVELLEAAAGRQRINCSKEGNRYTFTAVAGLDFWWTQLTGRLRVN